MAERTSLLPRIFQSVDLKRTACPFRDILFIIADWRMFL